VTPTQASREFKKRLEEVFYPSAQCLEILSEWMGLALGHCQSNYHGLRAFSAVVYDEDVPFPAFSFPMCLTGLAGTGKSQLLKALNRLMPPDTTFMAEDKTKFRLESHRVLTVQAKGSATDILVALTGQKSGTRELTRIARKMAYRDGWALLGVDEFQFLTQSDKANTRLVQLLMLIGYVGIPVIYISNFSMLHKLLRRNQEDRQRLLGNIWGLFPEQPNSSDWSGMLEWHKCIAPDVFEFDAEADAEAIHQLTGGINRAENKLLEVAFRRAMESGRAVCLRELEAAYKSRDYAVYRADIELLARLPFSAALQKANKDLWCPFEMAPCSATEEVFSVKRQERVGHAAIEASLNAAERSALKVLAKPLTPKKQQKHPKVVSIDKKKSLAEQLREDAVWFDEHS
jgi:energy-coupling factor transporter ATP-binding protein EcfA2